MDILCIMGLFPDEYKEQVYRDSIYGVQNAANNLQWSIILGLDASPDVNLRICNSMYIGSYPKRYRAKQIPTFEFSHTEGAADINVGFNNRSVVKYFSRYRGICREIDRWAAEHENGAVLAYAMAFPFVQILRYTKKHYPKLSLCLVVPDLPEYMNPARIDKKLYKAGKRLESWICRRCVSRVDCFVLLTDTMKEWFNHIICYTVVEGIASPTFMDAGRAALVNPRQKMILYAGMIEARYGVTDMVDAFRTVDAPDWTLEIYGDGTALGEIREIAQADPRIIIHGSVANDTVVQAQREASVLINPRKNNQEFTHFSFPSKIIEYMCSGTPVLAYKLDGMPDEYLPYFYLINDKKDGLAEALRKVIELPEENRRKMGEAALHFMEERKSAKMQCEKIISVIKDGMHGAKEKNTLC